MFSMYSESSWESWQGKRPTAFRVDTGRKSLHPAFPPALESILLGQHQRTALDRWRENVTECNWYAGQNGT